VPADGRLPGGTPGWGRCGHQEREVTPWMLGSLPDVGTWGFLLPLRPFEAASASGWDGDAWPRCYPTPSGHGGSWGAPRVSSMESCALQPRPPQPGPTPGFCLGRKPGELRLDKREDTGSQRLKTRVGGRCPQHVSRAAATAARSCPGSWPGPQVPGPW